MWSKVQASALHLSATVSPQFAFPFPGSQGILCACKEMWTAYKFTLQNAEGKV